MLTKQLKKENFVWGGLHPLSYHPLVFHFVPLINDKLTVDCGCGKGTWGYLLRTMRPVDGGKIIGIDVNQDYLDFCKKHKVYDRLIKGDITKLPFNDNTVDFLICSEVIEHLTKPRGVKFLKEIDRVMKKGGRVIITTPNTQMKTILGGYDAHHSLWGPQDFRNDNYEVHGFGVKISPIHGKWYTVLIMALGYFLTPISFIFPELSGFLIAIKDY